VCQIMSSPTASDKPPDKPCRNDEFDGITRLEVIGPDGRQFVRYCEPGVVIDVQDNCRTLKVFIGATVDPQTIIDPTEFMASIRQARSRLAAGVSDEH
jgi:hypothetical protein